MHKLLLMVASASMLEKGTFPRHQFDKRGGLVGSAKHATWYINNLKNEIASIEFEIKFYNSDFCLLAYSHHIFINGSQKPLPKNAIIRLKDGDIIAIANYELRVKVYSHKSDNVSLQDDLYSIVKNVGTPTPLSNEYDNNFQQIDNIQNIEKGDDLLTLKKEQFELDPLILLEAKQENDGILMEFSSPDLLAKEQYYKIINEYIDTNIESYEPLAIHSTASEPSSNERINNENIDLMNSLSDMNPEQTAHPVRCGKKEPNKTNIVDPLFFIK